MCFLHWQGFTQQQMHMVEDNSKFIQQREKEISQIVQSIHDLNEIFKDLAGMIVDQVRREILEIFIKHMHSQKANSVINP